MSSGSFGRRSFAGSRVWHRRAALVAALPLLITITTGLLLLIRDDFNWIQPKALTGVSKLASPRVDHARLLSLLKARPEAAVKDWADVASVVFNPGRGIYQVRLKNDYELQFDAANATLLHSQYRATNVLIELHQGSFFHPLVMKWVFLPTGLLLLSLWLSGVYLWLFPRLPKSKSRLEAASEKA